MSRRFVILTVSVCLCFAGPSVIGEDTSPATKATPNVDQHLLDDLSRIRQQMGGSVLKGSSLNSDDVDGSFKSDLKRLMFPNSPREPADTKQTQTSRLVQTLREQSTNLDRIANEIEPTKQYDHADQLRTAANELRKLARQFDKGRLLSGAVGSEANPIEQLKRTVKLSEPVLPSTPLLGTKSLDQLP